MATYLYLQYHLTLSTNRRECGLSSYDQLKNLRGLARGLGGDIHGLVGRGEQVHFLVSLRPTQCLAEFVRDFKKNSAVWIRESFGLKGFAWRQGYCALTVGPSGRAALRNYFALPKRSARRVSLREEFS